MVDSLALTDYLEAFRIWLVDAEFEQTTDGSLEVWNGSVTVEWQNPHSGNRECAAHRVAIILPKGFPYQAPIVLSKDDPPLAPSWHFAPEPSCSLCLWNESDGWKPYFTASRLLRRVEEWFVHYHTNQWPVNSAMPDLDRYLECLGSIVIDEEWNPPSNAQSGRFNLWHRATFGPNIPLYATCNSGCASLVTTLPENPLTQCLPLLRKETKPQSGIWFRLNEPFVPSANFAALLQTIDSHSLLPNSPAKISFRGVFGDKYRDHGFPIALGYIDATHHERWLFLWAKLPKATKTRHKLRWTDDTFLKQVTVCSFRTAPARKADLQRRAQYTSSTLDKRKVAIFGVGSLGSSIAIQLAKAGFGEIRIVDDDRLMPGNVIRHACGLNWVVFPKTLAVKSEIVAHNPHCTVKCFDSTWDMEQLVEYITHCDVVIDATANYNFSLLLNDICVNYSFPVVFATLYRKAVIGRLVVRRHSDDPCLACYNQAEYNWNEAEYPIIPALTEGSFVEDGCGNVTEEAVALDVETTANLVARVAVKVAQKQLEFGNLALVVNEAVPNNSSILGHIGTHWLNNQPLTQCAICRN